MHGIFTTMRAFHCGNEKSDITFNTSRDCMFLSWFDGLGICLRIWDNRLELFSVSQFSIFGWTDSTQFAWLIVWLDSNPWFWSNPAELRPWRNLVVSLNLEWETYNMMHSNFRVIYWRSISWIITSRKSFWTRLTKCLQIKSYRENRD
jgi:hypothetical protein